MSTGYERVLLMKSEVFVFRIPPLGADKKHKAADWNLDQPNWVGRLRLVTVDENLEIRLEDKTSGISGITLTAMGGPSLGAVQRLKKDYQKLLKDPVPFALAAPLQSNILEWHYVLFGSPDTPYEGGYYHGKLVFPADFPFRPPSIYMITPSGRFQPNTRLCLSISDFHPDTWNPSWTVSTIITGLISFMNENQPTLGSVNASVQERRALAKRSRDFNLLNPLFCSVFEELATQLRNDRAEERRGSREQDPTSETAADSSKDMSRSQETRETSSLVANVIMFTSIFMLALVVRYVIVSAQTAGE